MSVLQNNINTYQTNTDYVNDVSKDYPNISYIQASDEVKWNRYDPDHIVAVYNVTSTESATTLLFSNLLISYQIIDGVQQQSVQKTYTFSTTGEHIVKYKLSGTMIFNNTFQNCSALTSVTIPSSVTTIGQGAFSSCSGLTSVTILNGVTTIGQGAFSSCSGLTSVTIPSSVTSIGGGAFSRCTDIINITVDSGNTVYDSRNNCNAIIETASNTLFKGCNSTVIPSSVTSIGGGAFIACAGLTSVTIPNSVTSIGREAFRECTGLTSVTIPSGVTNIDNYGFYFCSGLTSVTIPSGVTSIGGFAFFNCSRLTSVTVQSTTPPTLGGSVFEYTNDCPIYVPAESVETYKAASGWSTYASRIQAIPSE